MADVQRVLSEEATEAFDHGWLFPAQVQHFAELTGYAADEPFRVLDVGGGTGLFAQELRQKFTQCSVTILDLSQWSVDKAKARGVTAVLGSILDPPASLTVQRFDVVVFNMILHHLVGDSDNLTEQNQKQALRVAASLLSSGGRIIFNEYCYSGFMYDDVSGRLIYELTSSKALAGVIRAIGRLFPKHLSANTVGVGVRFRPLRRWEQLGAASGLVLQRTLDGPPDPPSLVRRVSLLIREVRRSSAVFVVPEPPAGNRH